MTNNSKKQWGLPKLVIFGDVKAITKTPKLKNVGGTDDLAECCQVHTVS
jgi:hypothetical protein